MDSLSFETAKMTANLTTTAAVAAAATTTITTNSNASPLPVSSSSSPSSSSSSSACDSRSSLPSQIRTPPPLLVISPCAACKILRRRCIEKCVLAPYFPPSDPLKFTIAHRVFGASNIIKFLQELPESQRADAVSSMVYEANARMKDPVYGSAGVIWQLQKQVSELQEQLARAQAEHFNLQSQHTNLMALIFMEMAHSQQLNNIVLEDSSSPRLMNVPPAHSFQNNNNINNGGLFFEDSSSGSVLEQLCWNN